MFTRRFTESSASPMLRDSTHRLNLLIFCLLFAINAALPNFCLVATYGDTVKLVAGSGFTGPTLEPSPVGTPGVKGYDAKAIARWDVVPYQTFSGTFEIGVVAFHMIGVNRVEFSVEDGPWQAVNEMTLNPRTGVKEYWTILDANDCSDGPVKVRAIAYPAVGQPRLSDSLHLFANAGGTLTEKTVYVSTAGNDSNPGTLASPMRTITYAIDVAGDGGKIIILDEGLYGLGSTQRRRAFALNNKRYITVEAAVGLNRDNVIIGWPTRQLSRPYVSKMRWKSVSFDFSTISQYYADGCYVWFENCRWFQSEGWGASYAGQMHPVRGAIYVTDSLAEDILYGFVGVKLVRNSTTRQISGDAYQLSRMVLNCRAVNVNGTVSGHHTDIYQIWGYNENIIVYGLDTENIVTAQCIFLDHYKSSHTDYAFVDIYFDIFHRRGGPPFTQFNAAHNHVILRNVRWPGQKIMFRADMAGSKKFTANNVIFENCELYPESFDRYVLGIYTHGRGTPEGVTFKNCYKAGEITSFLLGLTNLTEEQISKDDVNENNTYLCH